MVTAWRGILGVPVGFLGCLADGLTGYRLLGVVGAREFPLTLVRVSDENRERVIRKQAGGSFERFSD
jgi:hypothetical protein